MPEEDQKLYGPICDHRKGDKLRIPEVLTFCLIRIRPFSRLKLIEATATKIRLIFFAVVEEALTRANFEEIRIPFGIGIAGHVAQTKEIVNIKDAYKVSLALSD